MRDLIEALTIFMKYSDTTHPSTCEHDMFFINCVKPDDVSSDDLHRLDALGFIPYEDIGFVSFKYGSN